MDSRTLPTVLVVCCLLLAGCLGFGPVDTSTETPTQTPTPDERFDLRVTNDRNETLAVDVWFVTGTLDGVVVTAANGSNTTYGVDDLRERPVAVTNASLVTPLGAVDRTVGLTLSGGVDGTADADVSNVTAVVYTVSTVAVQGDDRPTTDAGGASQTGEERLESVGAATCSDGSTVTSLTVSVGTETTTQVTCEG